MANALSTASVVAMTMLMSLAEVSSRVSSHIHRWPAGLLRVMASTGWLLTGHGSRLIIGLLVGLYVARYLGPEAYGTLSYAVSFCLLFAALAQFGLCDVVTRDLVTTPGGQAETLAAALSLRVAAGALAAGLMATTAWATHSDETVRLMIAIMAGGLLVEAFDIATPWFRSQVEARPTVLATLIAMGLASAFRVVLVLLEMPVAWFVWPVLLDAIVRVLLLSLFYMRGGGPRFRVWQLRMPRVRGMLGHAWPLALSAVLVMIQQRIDQVMLGILRGPSDVGWYAAAARLSEVWYFVPYAIATSLLPALIRTREGSPESYRRRLQLFFDVITWSGVAIALPAMLLAGPLIELLYGAAYEPSAEVLRIHGWNLALVAASTAWGGWVVAEGLQRIALVFAVCAFGSNVLLNWLLIPAFGATGAAWATLGAFAPPMLLRLVYAPTRPVALLMLKAIAAPLVRAASVLRGCQSAWNRDPGSAWNRDPCAGEVRGAGVVDAEP